MSTTPPAPPPPAPPLPPQRYGQRAATAIARLAQPFLYGSRPSSAHGNHDSQPKSSKPRPGVPQRSSPLCSKTVTHKTGSHIAALDISPDRNHVILAGPHILKTVSIQNGICAEDVDLRSNVIAYACARNASRNAVSARHKDHLAANDVKWSRGNFDSFVATAAASGRIVVYNLNRPGVELSSVHEHTRQVHKLAFSPFSGNLLLSGSQDGTVRLWDLRTLHNSKSESSFEGHDQGIRDVKWSTTDGVEFAAGTDTGMLQRWDIRKHNVPLLKIHAHDKTCHSLDWHPGGKYLVSGSADKTVKVWDAKGTSRRTTPAWLLRVPQSILNVRWRPLNQQTGEDALGSRQTTSIATTYDHCDPRIHLWDFCRPDIPFQELDRYDSPATDILWHSENLLWSVGHAGVFTQTDMKFAPRLLDRHNVNILAVAPDGGMAFFSDAKPRRRFSLSEAEKSYLRRASPSGSSGERFGSSLSANEGSLEEGSVLSSALKKRRQKAASTRHLAAPSSIDITPDERSEGAVNLTAMFQTTQVGAYGYVAGNLDVDAFNYLAQSYDLAVSYFQIQDASLLPEHIQSVFEKNAQHAAYTGQAHVAQVWRIMGWAVRKEFEARAKEARKQRLASSKPVDPQITDPSSTIHNFSSVPQNLDVPYRQHLLLNIESSSNVSTPRAKPVRHALPTPPDFEDVSHGRPEEERGKISLISSMMSKDVQQPQPKVEGNPSGPDLYYDDHPIHTSLDEFQADDDTPMSDGQSLAVFHEQQRESISPPLADLDLDRQMHERRIAMNSYRARPRTLLRFDDMMSSPSMARPVPYDRHDSNESFQMLSASSGSDRRSLVLASSLGDGQQFETANSIPEESERPELKVVEEGSPPRSLRSTSTELKPKEEPGAREVAVDTESDLDRRSHSTYSRPSVPIHRPSIFQKPIIHRPDMPSDGSSPPSGERPAVLDNLLSSIPDKAPPSEYLFSDYNSPEHPESNPKPWHVSAFLKQTIDFHLNILSDTQMTSHLILHLSSFYPWLFDTQHSTAVLLAYYKQLSSLRQEVPAAALRKACYPKYAGVTSLALASPVAGWYCQMCQKAVKGKEMGMCRRCKYRWGPCAICTLERPPPLFQDQDVVSAKTSSPKSPKIQPLRPQQARKGTSLWIWCQGCGHGGHSVCLQTWWADAALSEGMCVIPGCLHDCIPGLRRTQRREVLEAQRQEKLVQKGGVLKDKRVVEESKAVRKVGRLVTEQEGEADNANLGVGQRRGRGMSGRRVRLVEPTGRQYERRCSAPGGETTSTSMP